MRFKAIAAVLVASFALMGLAIPGAQAGTAGVADVGFAPSGGGNPGAITATSTTVSLNTQAPGYSGGPSGYFIYCGTAATYAKKVKAYVKRTSDNKYLQANGTWSTTYYEFVSNARTSNTGSLTSPWAGSCQGFAVVSGQNDYYVASLTLPATLSGTFAIKAKVMDNESDWTAAWAGPASFTF